MNSTPDDRASRRRTAAEQVDAHPTSTRRVPPGCCPGCLLEFATEPCALHRAAADLAGSAREALAFFEVNDDEDAQRVANLLRTAIAKAEGR
ncbi:MAG: hypothetical protein IT460_04010 [Planctomycetes bacterium]|nr:hypothetical protein [Planctomycetota bacterium]